ncbi:hypothetical protein UFOVP119_91 [uncultured Caudovirales phage]|uniref:Uncharacterized protein n=1 Tax=uncultured Caudovirales phage TaxID=2100421 RepID=A0A6J5LBI6_9CAUD|nr:hypothetical protein UFOVP119_91 [uncultured Caudovirales phage]
MIHPVPLVACIAGLVIGWATRGQYDELAMADAAKAADKAITKLTTVIERDYDRLAGDAAVAVALAPFKLEATRVRIEEIYRDIPPPLADCAAPPAARQLLIDAGASGSPFGSPAAENAPGAADPL